MRLRLPALLAALILIVSTAFEGQAQEATDFDKAVEGLERQAGLLPVYADTAKGRVLFELPAADPETGIAASFIYVEYLRAGLGSNPVGLDRAQNGSEQLVYFRRLGERIFIEAQNTRYIASAENPLERKAVKQSFAKSILWSGKIMAEAADGRILLDMSGFLLRDAHGIAQRLKARRQGSFKLAKDLSAVDAAASLVFPENLELEAILTFTSSEPGPEVRATTPEPGHLSLRMHHSFIKLPGPGYKMRAGDQRAGVIAMPVGDYSVPLDQPITRRVALRHRLEKINPGRAPSRVKEPIIYYVDPGAPEPVRTALIEGASWWAAAFEEAGFIDAYRVEVLPPGAHPLDARYNIINWVHRQTRGWSYGASIIDPRTGEIIKGNVLLGSLRVRQDRMIFEGLLGTAQSGKGGPNDPVQIALTRIRQLSAHEVGHTLGFLHNMAASTYGGRASVMDYPAPEVRILADGSFDLSNAYGVGVGSWDKFIVKYLYAETPPGEDEAGMLDAIVAEAIAAGLVYVGDPDSRPRGSAHPLGNLWDTGEEPVASLEHMMT
ncbi:MAG: zinc-dependent metalloprotease, partial [Sphingomonadales bacterium]